MVLLGAACGGGGASSGRAPDVSNVATATLPAQLPEVRIVGSGAVQGGARTYTVKSGDTLLAIASRFGVTLEELRAANPGLDSTRLTVGTAIRLPEPSGEPAPAATDTPAAAESPVPAPDTPTPVPAPTDTPGPTNTPSPLGQTYTVQAGDIPVTIAQRFGITVEALLAANAGINPTGLQVGQVLVIPPAPPTPPPGG
jgi:LysM repeat protein